MAQHFIHAGNDLVQVEGFRLEELLAAIGQQLPRQRGGAVGSLADFGRVFGQRISGGKVVEQQFTLADDDRQEAIEFVRDAADQFADGFHFLRLNQLGFKPFAHGDVHIRSEQAADLPLGIAQRYLARKQRDGVPFRGRLGLLFWLQF